MTNIEAVALLKQVQMYTARSTSKSSIAEALGLATSALKELTERKRGNWVHSEDIAWSGGGKTTCSACDWSYSDGAYLDVYEFNFCPNCGAEMKRRSE